MTKMEFLEKARNIHGYKYKYPTLPYRFTLSDKIEVLHNDEVYLQTVSKHLMGRCPEKTIKKLTTDDFIFEAKKIWGDKYDYSLTEYTGSLNNIKVIYNGIVYEQRAKSHLEGMAPEFRSTDESKIWKEISENDLVGENEIKEFLLKWNIDFIHKWKNSGLEFDFYLPKLRMCVEYDGRQHFEPITDFGGVSTLDRIKSIDIKKESYCEDNYINLIRIRYDQFDDIYQILWDNLSMYIKKKKTH